MSFETHNLDITNNNVAPSVEPGDTSMPSAEAVPDEQELRRRMYEHALVLAPRVRPDLPPEEFGAWVLSIADKNQKRAAA